MNIAASLILWMVYIISLYFSIFLFLVYLDKRSSFRATETPRETSYEPFISILVPAYNEEKTILKTLRSIYALDYSQEKMEVIVINDGSKDATLQVISQFGFDKPNMIIINQENKGKAAALNSALKIARGELFACLDADSFVHPFTLQKMLHIYATEKDERLAIVTPAMKVYEPKNMLQKVQWLEYLVIILIARLSSEMDSLYVAPGPFSLYKTAVIRRIGGFDEQNITEDQEIAYRIQQHHYRIKQCPDGYVYTSSPETLKGFYRQRRRWYLGGMICASKYKSMVGNKEYGDFGIMQMVKNVLGYGFAIVGIGLGLYLLLKPLVHYLNTLFLVHFDIWPYISNLKWKITFFTFMMIDFRKGFLVLFLMMIGYFLFWASLRNSREKAYGYGWIPLFPYFAYYYTLKAFILLVCVIKFARRKNVKW